MMSRKILGIVIGSSIGGPLFIFVMILLFNPGIFLKSKIKENLHRASQGRASVEDVTFGWSKGLGLSNFILLQKEKRRPAFRASRVQLKLSLLPLLHRRYVLHELEASELEVVKRLQASPAVGIDALQLSASNLKFAGELAYSPGETKGSGRLAGKGHIYLENGSLAGGLISDFMAALEQSSGNYSFESISTDFEKGKEGLIYLNNFLAKGALFDLELEGRIQTDQTLNCNTTVIISKEKAGEKVQKLFNLSDTNTLRIPVKLKGSLSHPKISIKAESLMKEMFKGIFQEK